MFDDMVTDMESNKKLSRIVFKRNKIQYLICFITISFQSI